ncbi:uncharacterized protein LOC143277255 [Babylonia areolata]|uniref:uncharacterized protein LOC143277255 n=1 Tax=Babylonia areolata TaxID=304850 RepID=UPI003FD6BD3F
MIRVVFNIVKSLFSLFFRPLKRLWCRRVKASEMDPGVPAMVTTTQSTTIDMTQSFNGAQEADMEMESWDAWDINQSQQSPAQNGQSNSAYFQHAARTYQQMRGRKAEPEPEPEPDYFQDMTPQVKRPAKILLKKKDNGSVNSSAISTRLSVMDVAPSVDSELQSWQEKENEWGEEVEEDLSWEAEEALRDKRRLERQQRALEQQRKKQQRESSRGYRKDSHHLGVKLS